MIVLCRAADGMRGQEPFVYVGYPSMATVPHGDSGMTTTAEARVAKPL